MHVFAAHLLLNFSDKLPGSVFVCGPAGLAAGDPGMGEDWHQMTEAEKKRQKINLLREK